MPKKYFTEKELLFIRENAQKYTLGKFAKLFHCSVNDVNSVCETLGVTIAKGKKWTNAEEEYLIENHLKLTDTHRQACGVV